MLNDPESPCLLTTDEIEYLKVVAVLKKLDDYMKGLIKDI